MDALAAGPSHWSLLRRFGFRFVFVYFVLYSLPWPLGWIPGTGWAAELYEQAHDALLAWFGNGVLGVERDLEPFPTGSGDTTRDFVALPLKLSLAALAAIGWSLFDRRGAHPRLADLLRTYLRYVLASAMLGYGAAKWFSGQFPPLDVARLQTSWGDCSPMGVVWRFMGSSQAYTAFSGIVECLGGLLLLFRRTASLGALVAIAAMTNVVLINFCYDVPVKLYSSHLLLMAVAVLWRDLPRLAGVLIRHRDVPAAPLRLPEPRWWTWTRRPLAFAAIGWLLYGTGAGVVARAARTTERGPLDGCYEVVGFERSEPADKLAAAPRWRRVRCGWGRVVVEYESGPTDYFVHEIDPATRTLKMSRIRPPGTDDPRPDLVMTWRGADEAKVELVSQLASMAPADGAVAGGGVDAASGPVLEADGARTLVLEGQWEGAPVVVHLREPPLDSFFLQKRSFQWIQEFPVNR